MVADGAADAAAAGALLAPAPDEDDVAAADATVAAVPSPADNEVVLLSDGSDILVVRVYFVND